MKYNVTVEKKMYDSGTITIEADSPDQAITKVQDLIDKGKLQTSEVTWNEAPQYEDCSFKTTGDVD